MSDLVRDALDEIVADCPEEYINDLPITIRRFDTQEVLAVATVADCFEDLADFLDREYAMYGDDDETDQQADQPEGFSERSQEFIDPVNDIGGIIQQAP